MAIFDWLKVSICMLLVHSLGLTHCECRGSTTLGFSLGNAQNVQPVLFSKCSNHQPQGSDEVPLC